MNSLYKNTTRTRTFSQIFPDVHQFLDFIESSAFELDIANDLKSKIYYMLYANYGNNPIASSDENRFKYKMLYIIDSYGPTWARRTDLQVKLRHLTDEDLMTGATNISNHAYSPATEPSTSTLDELLQLDQQNTSKMKRSKVDAYSLLNILLKDDLNETFIKKFQSLFLQFVEEEPILYTEEDCDNGY